MDHVTFIDKHFGVIVTVASAMVGGICKLAYDYFKSTLWKKCPNCFFRDMTFVKADTDTPAIGFRIVSRNETREPTKYHSIYKCTKCGEVVVIYH